MGVLHQLQVDTHMRVITPGCAHMRVQHFSMLILLLIYSTEHEKVFNSNVV